MYFTLTIGTLFLSIIGILFVLLVRTICQKDVLGEQIGQIDKFMLVSLFVHILWAFAVDLLSHAGYQYLVWDDETYHSFAMGSMYSADIGSNLYSYILRFLYSTFGNTTVTGRIANLFFSVATIYPLATIEKRLNTETHYSATKFFAYSPFIIFISYFEIKDIILTFMFISSYAIVKRLTEKNSIPYLAVLIALCVISEQFRAGTGVLPIAILVLSRLRGPGSNKVQRRVFAVISTAIVLAIIIYIGQDYLQFGLYRIDRYQRWIFTQFSSDSLYSRFVVTQFADIWKIPFCFILYTLQPLDLLSGNMRYLTEFGMIAKIADVPILFFSILLLPRYIKKEKWNSLFFIVFYSFTSCINLTNSRQGFFLYPIMYLIFFDSFLSFESQEEHADGSLIYRNGHIWKLAVESFYFIWILFVLYRLFR
jgi:hypothetical protein